MNWTKVFWVAFLLFQLFTLWRTEKYAENFNGTDAFGAALPFAFLLITYVLIDLGGIVYWLIRWMRQ